MSTKNWKNSFSSHLLSPLIQFNLLHSKFHLCSVPTRALLLSTYIKFVNLFPEIKTTIQDVLRSDSQLKNADVELQQRAVEYLRLSTIASTDILVGIKNYYCYYYWYCYFTEVFTCVFCQQVKCAKCYLVAQKSLCGIKDPQCLWWFF